MSARNSSKDVVACMLSLLLGISRLFNPPARLLHHPNYSARDTLPTLVPLCRPYVAHVPVAAAAAAVSLTPTHGNCYSAKGITFPSLFLVFNFSDDFLRSSPASSLLLRF